MVASLNHLFLSGLDDEGIYIAEDTHTNFWSDYRDQRYSFVDLCKDLVDVMHSHYEILTSEPGYRLGHAAHTQMLSVPRISAQIKEITFRDSIIAIRKKKVAALPTSVHL